MGCIHFSGLGISLRGSSISTGGASEARGVLPLHVETVRKSLQSRDVLIRIEGLISTAKLHTRSISVTGVLVVIV